ncbi:hypothetical protein ACGFIG_11105 [Micromonospora sp. NPDC049048]|uniref:hypothetical protein n=1 Tax=Micromonospora sp. NPDC049048 TaxID=3364263 RepID=UPI003722D831
MTAAQDEFRRLVWADGDPERPDAPEPTLLPWLAAHTPLDDHAVRLISEAAARCGDLATAPGWPVVSDATAELLAERAVASAYLPPAGFDPADPASLDRLSLTEIAYLFPRLSPAVRAAGADLAVSAVRNARRREPWYVSALCARIAPFLASRDRNRLLAVAEGLPRSWTRRLDGTIRRQALWSSAREEIAASHPATARLDEIAARLPAAPLAALCLRAIEAIHQRASTGPVTDAAVAWPVTDAAPIQAVPLEDSPPSRTTRPRLTPDRLPGVWLEDTAAEAPARWVSTGIADVATPGIPVDPTTSLAPDTAYVFWLQVGEPVDGAIPVEEPRSLVMPPDAGPGSLLTVAVFGYPGGLRPRAGADVGSLVLREDGTLAVHRQPDGRPATGSRLYFPVRTGAGAGDQRLRCNIYCNGTLLQSRVVTVSTAPGGPARWSSVLDYAVETRLGADRLSRMPATTLSVFVNDNGGGTHGFRFLSGTDNLKGDVVLGDELQGLVDGARRALRRTSWGDEHPMRGDTVFRYHDKVPADFDRDLIRLAVRGCLLWTKLAGEVAETIGADSPDEAPIRWLRDRMRRPGIVEMASKVTSRLVVPAALFYDHPLDQGADGLRLCPDAARAIAHRADLASEPCFLGDCPHYDDRTVVCPAGFWGFRHEIGLPQSVLPATQGLSNPLVSHSHEIDCGPRPRCLVPISTEFDGDHVNWVKNLGDHDSKVLRDRGEALVALESDRPPTHLIYFFGHGAIVDGQPVLLVGPPTANGIGYPQISDGGMWWPQGRPLVFLNGCRTAATEPRYAMSFVEAFVRRARASGLVGTEIETYDSLAVEFGRAVLDRFVTRRLSLAAAIRGARLQLLSRGNPLGLIYVPYASPHLRLVGTPAG